MFEHSLASWELMLQDLKVLQAASTVSFPPGAKILRKAEQLTSAYLILSGSVEIINTDPATGKPAVTDRKVI